MRIGRIKPDALKDYYLKAYVSIRKYEDRARQARRQETKPRCKCAS